MFVPYVGTVVFGLKLGWTGAVGAICSTSPWRTTFAVAAGPFDGSVTSIVEDFYSVHRRRER